MAKGADHLEKKFSRTLKNTRYKKELEAGILCDLGEEWQSMNILLTGEPFPTGGAASLPVLGGEHIATMETQTDVLLILKPELVHASAHYLQGIDGNQLAAERKSKLRVAGGAPDWMIDTLIKHIENLREFYCGASAIGNAVTKRVYS